MVVLVSNIIASYPRVHSRLSSSSVLQPFACNGDFSFSISDLNSMGYSEPATEFAPPPVRKTFT